MCFLYFFAQYCQISTQYDRMCHKRVRTLNKISAFLVVNIKIFWDVISVVCSQWDEFEAQSRDVWGRGQKGQPGSAGGRGREASGREGEAGEDGRVSQLEGEVRGDSRQVQSSGGPQGSEAEQRSKTAFWMFIVSGDCSVCPYPRTADGNQQQQRLLNEDEWHAVIKTTRLPPVWVVTVVIQFSLYSHTCGTWMCGTAEIHVRFQSKGLKSNNNNNKLDLYSAFQNTQGRFTRTEKTDQTNNRQD